MSDSLGVLETCRLVAERSEKVRIDQKAVETFCGELVGQGIEVPPWDFRYHFFDGTEKTVTWLLVLDALNFCFWKEPRWEIEYESERLRGYFALAASLKRAVEEGLPLLEAKHLRNISLSELTHIFRGGKIPLFEERLRILREMARC